MNMQKISSPSPFYVLCVSVAGETDSPGIAARALANIADVLGCMAGSHGGLRSGPSANSAWKHAYELLEV